MTNVKTVLPFVSNNEVILTGIFESYEITFTYKIIKETLAYRPVALSFEEAKRLFLRKMEQNLEAVKVTDINGNSFYAQLESVIYGGPLVF